jgi:tryptophan halogenase
MKPISSILIVGGGTAGWLTAAFLAKSLGVASSKTLSISVVESPEIGIIGVGEGTFPSIRGTLAAIGIDEARFVKECNASFKQGIKFVDWVRPKGSAGIDHYFHPFSQPSQRQGGPELLPYWLLGAAGNHIPFAQAATMQKRIADASHAPKRNEDGDFLGPMNYAYHFDASLFAKLLETHAKSLGVQHISATIEQVQLTEDGAIAAVITHTTERLTADLYVDCSGFRARLIGQALGSAFTAVDELLFVDRALAVQVPYPASDSPIPSYTISTAQEAGWIWDIGLQQRRGVGHVYSSRHTDDARAEQVLRDYLRDHNGPDNAQITPRMLKLKVGYREVHWIKNCVAIGLSGGFLEPLEASGIGLIETAVYLLSYLFPHDGNTAPVAKLFNSMMKDRYERIVDFVKMHYCISQRKDSQFWLDNTDTRSIPESLQEKLAMWRCRPPHRLDFITDLEMYPPSSWQYVLYGMEFKTTLQANALAYPRMEEARQEFQMIEQMARRALDNLPTHRALIAQFCARYQQQLLGKQAAA